MIKNVFLFTRNNLIGWVKVRRNELLVAALLAFLLFLALVNITRLLKAPSLSIYQQGQNLYNAGHYTASLDLLKQAVAAASNEETASRLTLAKTYLALNEPLQAEVQLKMVLYYHPQNVPALYLSGQAFLQENRFFDAEQVWYKVVKLNQSGVESVQARLALGERYFRSGRYEDAAGLIYKALLQGRGILRPDDLQKAYYLYALVLAHDGRYNDAATQLERVTKLKTEVQGTEDNGRVLNNLRNLGERADLMLPPLLQARDETVEAARRAKLGYAYLLANEYNLAEAQFQRALQLVPAFADMRAYLGLIYWQTGRKTLAATTFDQALQTDPNSRLARQLLAEYDLAQVQSYQPGTGTNLELIKARGEQARQLLQGLIRQNPNDALAEIDLAQLDVAERAYSSAVKHFEHAISLTGGKSIQGVNPGVQLMQLYTNQGMDPCGSGLQIAKKTLENTPADALAWYEAGLNYFLCRQPQPALEDMQRALQLRPNWPEAIYRLGLIFQAQGDHDKAENLFDQALDLDPTSSWAH